MSAASGGGRRDGTSIPPEHASFSRADANTEGQNVFGLSALMGMWKPEGSTLSVPG